MFVPFRSSMKHCSGEQHPIAPLPTGRRSRPPATVVPRAAVGRGDSGVVAAAPAAYARGALASVRRLPPPIKFAWKPDGGCEPLCARGGGCLLNVATGTTHVPKIKAAVSSRWTAEARGGRWRRAAPGALQQRPPPRATAVAVVVAKVATPAHPVAPSTPPHAFRRAAVGPLHGRRAEERRCRRGGGRGVATTTDGLYIRPTSYTVAATAASLHKRIGGATQPAKKTTGGSPVSRCISLNPWHPFRGRCWCVRNSAACEMSVFSRMVGKCSGPGVWQHAPPVFI